jgi:hypothetical protein
MEVITMKQDVVIDAVVIASMSIKDFYKNNIKTVEEFGWTSTVNTLEQDILVVLYCKGWIDQFQEFQNKNDFSAINCTAIPYYPI